MKWTIKLLFILILTIISIRLSESQTQKQIPKMDILYLFYQSENLIIWHSWDIDTTKDYGKPVYQRIKLNKLWKQRN